MYKRIFLNYLLVVILNLLFLDFGFAQVPNDCVNALPICSNATLSQNINGMGIDDFASALNESSCLLQGEHQSVWLYVRIESGTNFGFDLSPNTAGEDFDFAVYGPNVNCDNLGRPIRCSWAGQGCLLCPNTGLNSTSMDFSEGIGGDGYLQWLDVTPGETYFILIDKFTPTAGGFVLNWTGDGQSSLDCEITFICPTVDLGDTVSLCNGDGRQIGIGPVPTDTYLWNTGATSSLIDVTTSGWYTLQVSRQACVELDSVFVEVNELDVDLGRDTILCDNSTLLLDATNVAAQSYLWSDNSNNASLTISAAGTYWVELSNNDCTIRDSIVVSYVNSPTVDLGADSILCNRDVYVLSVPFLSGNTSYLWQNNSTESSFSVVEEGTYFVSVSNECGMASDTASFQYESCDCNLYFPSVFTPNNDGINDQFGALIVCDNVMDYKLEIFNRWGEPVFETNDVNTRWDGVAFGNETLLDVYVWQVEYKWMINETESSRNETGYVTVLR